MRSIALRSLLLCLLAVVLLVGIGFGVKTWKASASQTLSPAGKWNLVVTFLSDGSKHPSEMDLNLTSSASPYTGSLVYYAPSGTGQWYAMGSDQFSYNFQEAFYYNGTEVGYVIVQQQATLSADGNSFDAHGWGMYVSLTGSPPSPINYTTTHATRM
jgi:hypothetical protein